MIPDMQPVSPGGAQSLGFLPSTRGTIQVSKSAQHLLEYNKDNALEFSSGTFVRDPNDDLRMGSRSTTMQLLLIRFPQPKMRRTVYPTEGSGRPKNLMVS
jgi:hypothetical protein